MSEAGGVLWTPSPGRIAASNLARFARQAGFDPDDYAALHAWSVREPESFHAALWDFVGIIGDRGETIVAPHPDLMQVRFFPDARLNYAETVLRDADDRLALVAHRDDGSRRAVTRRELRDLVSRCVQALRSEGIGPGDRVGAILTNDIEAIALYLATAAIGAIWASCSPDFGPAGAEDRLGQVKPSILFAVPHYTYAGKRIDATATINAVAAAPSVLRTVLVDAEPSGASQPSAISLTDWLAPFAPGPIDYHRAGFSAPMAILFSSGTTGKPKGIVHTAGGLLLQHMKEHQLHCDVKPGDRLFYYTTCGWMMWNWLVTGLASGATIVTYDGNPAYPAAGRLADLIDAEGLTIFGTSARYLDSASKAGVKPRATHSLASLRTILSTGSPLLPDSFDYVYDSWKNDVHLASISGGSDICACFLGGVPTRPVRRGELQGPMLGMDVATVAPDGSVLDGAAGELICRNAHISMPLCFWNDDDGSRYRAAYFERLPGVWTHGDFVEHRPSDGYVIFGRSDTTLNPGGVRIGTAEIYRQVEGIPQILEAVAVGQDWDGDQRIVLFVRMQGGQVLDDTMREHIRARIRSGATPRHVPARIVAVPDIPRTQSGKISEVAVRDAINGRPATNTAALANPEALAFLREIPELGT